MNPLEHISAFADEIIAIRRDIHAHPEIGFEEVRTSALVAEKLQQWGVEVHRGLGKTGVVGVIHGRGGGRRIGLRADMDALPIDEQTNLPWRSTVPGKMHACGHDGHTAILLGAAKYLAETRNFDGTVVCIFQPAEEGLGGARAMIADGLFKRFPCDELYALHNAPDGPRGEVSILAGPAMAAADFFDIRITGRGSHGAHPYQSIDPTMIAVQLASAMQTIVSRNVSPLKAAVVSITQLHAGSAYNVIPETAHLAGTIRTFDDDVRKLTHKRVRTLAAGLAASFEATIEVDIRDTFSVLINNTEQAQVVADVAREIVGADNLDTTPSPKMGSEDFADMLHNVPGAYFWLGGTEGPAVHNPGYVFDDAIVPIGSAMLARIAEQRARA